MTTDLSQFLQTFYEESFEGLDVMESGLLNLDVGAADSELVNEIFRAAHSIKGGAATFGLAEVADFTHLMETLLDQLRDGRRPVSQPLVDLLLAAVDVLREMLGACKAERPIDGERVGVLKTRLRQILDGGQGATADAPPPQTAHRPLPTAEGGWRIRFRPHRHLFMTGNDPVRIFRELDDLGDLTVVADLSELPSFDNLDPESSYLAWEVTLSGTTVAEATVRDVFAWIEDDCDLVMEPLASPPLASPATALRVVGGNEQPVSGELLAERRKGERRKAGGERRAAGQGDGSSIRVNIEKIDSIINLVGELVITQSMLSTLGESFDMGKIQKLRDGLVQLERNTRELQEEVMRMRMLPIGSVFHRFPRMVHDLSSRLGKQAELRMFGESTELDKTLVEKITDPLVHLVRNALDHGIEPPEERIAAGKSPAGTVSLNAYHKGGNIVIEVADDGRGLSAEKIRAKAIEKGLLAHDTPLNEEQTYELLFLPGFSTADKVSDVSGRGVGMDVVRRNIQSLNGSVEISSERNRGSTFTVRLPLTLAILDGQSVAVGDQTYIVPLVSISESIQIKAGMVNLVAGRGEAFQWRGEYLPIIRLADLFGIESRARDLKDGLLVVVEGDGRHVGLFVDDLLGQQQVVIKSMEVNYRKVEGISGATILGDGSVALILDIPSLIRNSSVSALHGHDFKRAATA